MSTQELLDQLAIVVDKSAVGDLITKVGRAQDTRDWVTYAGCFAHQVLVEQPMDPSWVPQEVAAAEWAKRAASTLDGFDLTHHCLFNLRVDIDGDVALAEVDLVARHEIGTAGDMEVYTLGGRYYIALLRTDAGWRISSRRLQVRWEEGDPGLMSSARERVAARGDGVAPAYR